MLLIYKSVCVWVFFGGRLAYVSMMWGKGEESLVEKCIHTLESHMGFFLTVGDKFGTFVNSVK